MITYKTKPDSEKEIKELLIPEVRDWFFTKFKNFSEPQLYSVLEVHNRSNILLSAPTGSGKTLSSFIAILNELIDCSKKGILENKVYCVYISPLKALSRDIQKNLLEPLQEIEEIAKKEYGIRITIRTGDSTQAEKVNMLKNPPHILITTPESLAILLTSYKFRDHLKAVDFAILDEIHSLAENKRGTHLALSLERLQHISPGMCRIGLSATISPLSEIAKFLVGSERDCKVIDVQYLKKFDLEVTSPVKDLVNSTYQEISNEMYKLVHKLIQEHKTTLIFTNTRAGTESIVHNLKDKFPRAYTDENIGAHHGSLSKELRFNTEDSLKQGKMKAIVCLEGNTKILDSKGNWIKIKDLEHEKVQSLNKNLKLNNNQVITRVVKENEEGLLKLKTEFGKEVICTKEHKFLTLKEGKLKWKEANDLEKDEFVATIRNYSFDRYTQEELINLTLQNYPDDGFLVMKKSFLEKLRKEILLKEPSLKQFWDKYLQGNLAYHSFLVDLSGKFLFKVSSLKRILSILKISNKEFYENIIDISSSKVKSKRIEFNEEFMRLLGFMCAEGYLSKYALFVSNRDKELLEYYSNLIENLSGRDACKKLGSTGTPILFWQSTFLSTFLKNLGFKVGRKARILNIPDFIFRLDRNLVSSFISGYIDGDGFIEIKSKEDRAYAIGFCTSSKQMTEDVSRLLLREGIISSVRSKYVKATQNYSQGRWIKKEGWFYEIVILGGDHTRKFASFINPIRRNLKRINESLELNGYCNRDVVPSLGKPLRKIRLSKKISNYFLQKNKLTSLTKYELENRNISRRMLEKVLNYFKNNDKNLRNLANSDLFWEKVKLKEEVAPTEFVYNIEVENDHNYVANGFLTKNCSTSLELGIDIGSIDLVICIGSPKSVARALQRLGRSNHQVEGVTKGKIIVTDRDDLVECSCLLKDALERKIDRIHIPMNCLDVLAQQIVGMSLEQVWDERELFKVLKQAYPYHDLTYKDYEDILKYLNGEYLSLEERSVYGKIWRNEGSLGKRGKLARVIYMTNIGTIPDQSGIKVKLGNFVIGTIDEAFLEKLKVGDIFVLGGSTYEFRSARGMMVTVRAAAGRLPTVPRWFSDNLPLSFDLAMQIQTFRKLMEEKMKDDRKSVLEFIDSYLYVDKIAAEAIYNYFKIQYDYIGIPHKTKIFVENYIDEKGKLYVIFHTLFGRRVNDCLSRAIAYIVARTQNRDIEVGISDNGFYLSSIKKINGLNALKLLKSSELEAILKLSIDKSEILRRRFRHCAGRGLMILRSYKGNVKTAGRQQVSSMILLVAVRAISEDFPILKETRREIFEDLMDLENAIEVVKLIENDKIKVKEISTLIPSPFGIHLVLQGYSDILKIEERHEFLKRMHEYVQLKISMKK